MQPPMRGAWKLMLPLVIVLLAVFYAAWHFGWHTEAVGAGVILLAFVTKLFIWLLGVIALVPVIGPIIVKVLSLSVIWLLNAVGYIVSIVAIKRGYSKDVLTYRGLTLALIIGIVIGYVIGHFV
ncbi:MAG: hypothetical protein CVU29_08470 [Betaproteobacteria bacterium HGW-Betaproteobacteria-22]|nr:MAG: hypothetical protein CVU29_08470 [Betaproteobacteria bacterium HGW-Betaproteobacteria-22]